MNDCRIAGHAFDVETRTAFTCRLKYNGEAIELDRRSSNLESFNITTSHEMSALLNPTHTHAEVVIVNFQPWNGLPMKTEGRLERVQTSLIGVDLIDIFTAYAPCRLVSAVDPATDRLARARLAAGAISCGKDHPWTPPPAGVFSRIKSNLRVFIAKTLRIYYLSITLGLGFPVYLSRWS